MSRRWLVMFAALAACTGQLCGEPYLAELTTQHGEVQRDDARTVGRWRGAERGDRFRIGDGLRTGSAGRAELALAPDGVALVEANTVLRFLDRDPRGAGRRIAIEEGVVRVESGQLDLDVRTAQGLARVRQGSTLRIVASGHEASFDVLVGRVAIDANGDQSELVAGQKIGLGAAAQPPSQAASVQTAEREPEPAQPRNVDVALPSLESMILHSPSVPLTLGLPAPSCAGAIQAEVDGRVVSDAASGDGLVLRLTRAGAHRVRLRCDKRVVRDATLELAHDAATLELPKSAQRVEIEADGRRYTVRYQNLLPIVTLRWSDARPSSSYSLVLQRGSKNRSYRTTRPQRELPSGELAEGNYEFWFTGANGQKSPPGGLRVEFDNTARSLSLSQPSEGASALGDHTLVSGVALLRSQVSANGVPLPLDAKGRFHAQVPLSAQKSVWIRAIHPGAGVHYYVRRLH